MSHLANRASAPAVARDQNVGRCKRPEGSTPLLAIGSQRTSWFRALAEAISVWRGQWGRRVMALAFESLDPAPRQFSKEASLVADYECFEFGHIVRALDVVPSPECGSDILGW